MHQFETAIIAIHAGLLCKLQIKSHQTSMELNTHASQMQETARSVEHELIIILLGKIEMLLRGSTIAEWSWLLPHWRIHFWLPNFLASRLLRDAPSLQTMASPHHTLHRFILLSCKIQVLQPRELLFSINAWCPGRPFIVPTQRENISTLEFKSASDGAYTAACIEHMPGQSYHAEHCRNTGAPCKCKYVGQSDPITVRLFCTNRRTCLGTSMPSACLSCGETPPEPPRFHAETAGMHEGKPNVKASPM